LLIFAGFRRLLPLGFELGFCRKAFSFVLRHGFRVIQNAGRILLQFGLAWHRPPRYHEDRDSPVRQRTTTGAFARFSFWSVWRYRVVVALSASAIQPPVPLECPRALSTGLLLPATHRILGEAVPSGIHPAREHHATRGMKKKQERAPDSFIVSKTAHRCTGRERKGWRQLGAIRLQRTLPRTSSNQSNVLLKCKRKRWILPRKKLRERPPQNARLEVRILSLIPSLSQSQRGTTGERGMALLSGSSGSEGGGLRSGNACGNLSSTTKFSGFHPKTRVYDDLPTAREGPGAGAGRNRP